MIDQFGRRVTYLRVSVTDRCNFRCVYCMPSHGVEYKAPAEILSFEEIARVVRAASDLGVRAIRITGGEPLVRKDLAVLVRGIASIPGIEDVSLTTNGFLLKEKSPELRSAGLKRVNVSLDTLNPEKFRRLTRLGDLDGVLEGIDAALEAGFAPVKINSVVIKDFNDDEITDLASLAVDRPIHVRFIEIMPIGECMSWGYESLVPAEQIRSILSKRWELIPFSGMKGFGPARYYRIPGGAGTIGLISAMSEHFCETCNRLRLTADGEIRPCLHHDMGVDVKSILRDRETDDATKDRLLRQAFRDALTCKPESHRLLDRRGGAHTGMSQVGG